MIGDPKEKIVEMTKKELDEIIERHGKWLRGEEDGVFADLSGAKLKGADLSDTDLRETNLRGANLKGVKLVRANLSEVNLREANLKGADLGKANIKGADLRGANLEGAALNKYTYQIKIGGTYDTTTTYDAVNNQVIWEHWICDDGNTLENFEKMIEDVYGDNEEPPVKKRYQEYMGAINFFKAMKKLKG